MSVAGKTTTNFAQVTTKLARKQSEIYGVLDGVLVICSCITKKQVPPERTILRPKSFCVSSGEAQRSDPHYIRIQIEFHQLLDDILTNRQLETDSAKRKQN